MRSSILLLSLAASITPLRADPSLANVFARDPVSLNGKWNRIIDPYDTGYYDYRGNAYDASPKPSGGYFLDLRNRAKSDLVEYDFDSSPTLDVPGDWNSQDPHLDLYEGSVWYRKLFDKPATGGEGRLFLYVGAANYESDVYLNGRKLGKHIGGFTPFAYEITSPLRDKENSLVIRVNNRRHPEAVPTTNTDWWNYGGITRDVLLVRTPKTFIRDYHIQLKKGAPDHIDASVKLDGAQAGLQVRISIPDADIDATANTGADGTAAFDLPAGKLTLWSPEHPNLHAVTVSAGEDHISERIGFRSIETRGSDILLNGKPVFLRGICIHEEIAARVEFAAVAGNMPLIGACEGIGSRAGRAHSLEDAKLLLTQAKELNCNFVRLAHYPHNEHMARVADELGLMLWEEVPVYWTIRWENPDTLRNATTQLTDLITRDHNRASVIVWSVANETPVGEARTRFLKSLVDTARSLDNTRLISAAMEVRTDSQDNLKKIVDDPFGEFTDIVSFNQYIGWYDGLPDKLDKVKWSIRYDKPVIVSEFGADAKQGMHGDALTRFSEEYQADVYRRTLPMLRGIPQFRGVTPWILYDFRSPRRQLPGIQDGWNRKGLIGENGQKKLAFGVLKSFYDEMAATAEKP